MIVSLGYQKGVVPKYLRERKEGSHAEAARADLEHSVCPPGHVTLPDTERKETLRMLRNSMYHSYWLTSTSRFNSQVSNILLRQFSVWTWEVWLMARHLSHPPWNVKYGCATIHCCLLLSPSRMSWKINTKRESCCCSLWSHSL